MISGPEIERVCAIPISRGRKRERLKPDIVLSVKGGRTGILIR